MTERPVRIPPIPIHEWGNAQKQVLAAFIEQMPEDLQGGAKEGETDYTGLELLLNHPNLAKAFLGYSQWLLQDNELPIRDRELVILRVGFLIKSEYEWAQHVLIAQHEDISDEDIRRVAQGPDAPEWSDKERFLLSAVDDLLESAVVSDKTWKGLVRYYGIHPLMEIMFTAGSYYLMGMVYNTMGAPLNEKLQDILRKMPLEA